MMPSGLSIIERFIAEEHERDLIAQIEFAMQGVPERSGEHRSRILRFGFDYDDPAKALSPPPDWLPAVPDAFDSATVNEYQPGRGILPHYDSAKFGPVISVLSLGSHATMEFISDDCDQWAVLVPRRTLVVMRGDSRYTWKHGIPAQTHDVDPSGKSLPRTTRYSIVYRKRICSGV